MKKTEPTKPSPRITAGHARVGGYHAVPGLIRSLGGQPEAVLRPLRLSEEFLQNPDNILPIATLGELLHRGAQETACEHFGLLAGSHSGVGQIGAPGKLLLLFPTVGLALDTLQRFFHLHNRAAIVILRRKGDRASLVYSVLTGNFTGFQELQDGALAVALNIMRRLLGKQWCPSEVQLIRREPENHAVYSRFFGAPCIFNATRSGLVFPASTLDLPLCDPGATSRPDSTDAHSAETTTPESGAMDWIELVRRTTLGLLLAGRCSQQSVAATLGISTRTLNRHLEHAGSSFREIADYSRFTASRMLIRETDMPLGNVARLLNYSDLSSFGRAFKRWTGTAPSAWRQGHKIPRHPNARPGMIRTRRGHPVPHDADEHFGSA